MIPFSLRHAEPSDVPVVVTMIRAWWDEEHSDRPHLHPGPSRPATSGGHADRFHGTTIALEPDDDAVRAWDARYTFVAEANGELVGWINGRLTRITGTDLVTFDPSEHVLTIDTLYVEPSSRRFGVGSALARAVSDQAHEDGITDAAVDSVWADGVIAFYRSLGFEPTYVRYARRGTQA